MKRRATTVRAKGGVCLWLTVLALGAGGSLIAVSSAQAREAIDGNCNTNAYYPQLDGSSYRVQGAVYCNTSTTMYLQVCAMVENSGNWYWITNSCVPSDPFGGSFEAFFGTSTGTNPYYGKWELGVCGHVYESAAPGSDNATFPSYAIDYSRSETQCS